MIFQLTIKNEQEFRRGLDKAILLLQQEILRASGRAASQTAGLVQEESDRNAPVVTGRLVRSSVAVAAVPTSPETVKAGVGYTAPYAARVHEDMEGRKPKFLERAVLSVGPRFRQIALKELR